MGIHVIVATATGEEAIASPIADRLKREGLSVLCRSDLVVGDSFVEEIEKALEAGASLVFCGSERAVKDGRCKQIAVAVRAMTDKRRIYPLRMEEGVNLDTVAWGSVVAEYWRDPSTELDNLVAAIRKHNVLQVPGIGSSEISEVTPTGFVTISSSRSKPRLLLVKLPVRHHVKNHDFGVPLGLWTLKSYLRREGISASVFDGRLELVRGSGRTFEDVVSSYDIIGFSACTSEIPRVLEAARLARDEGKTTILGGIFAATNEQLLLRTELFDYVIPGIATHPLAELMHAIERTDAIPQIKGVYTVSASSQHRRPWMTDTPPSIDFATLDEIIAEYGPHLDGKLDIVTSRGCSHHCSFCSIQKEQHTICHRNEAEVVEEIIYAAEHGFSRISIKDEIFPHLPDRANRILEAASRYAKDSGRPIEFKVKSRVDTLLKHENLIEKYYEWGVREIQFGVEALNVELLKFLHKGYGDTASKLRSFLDLITSTGIMANVSLILGIEGESERYYDELRRWCENLRNPSQYKVYVNFYTPHPSGGQWRVPDSSKLINRDLTCFNHKLPVLAPFSARTRKARQLMVNAYSDIVRLTKSKDFNPPIPYEVSEEFIAGDHDYSSDAVLMAYL